MLSNKVLIVDDDKAVLQMLNTILTEEHLATQLASDGQMALKLLEENKYALMLLDINMPGINGYEVIERIRRKKINVPIIVVSGRKEDMDTLHALKIGADEYITKPFNPVTLGAKVKALIRRSQTSEQPANAILEADPFTYDPVSLKFYKNGVEIELTSKENAMMKLFMDNIGRVFTKESIYEIIWSNSVFDANTITVYINRLRQKIEENPSDPVYLKTIRGLGYRFMQK